MFPSVQVSDPSFQPQHSGKCDLHIEILPQGLKYAVVDKGQDQLKVLCSIPGEGTAVQQIQQVAQSASALNNHFRKIKIVVPGTSFIHIPVELFNQEKLVEYARFLNQKADEDTHINYLPAAKCVAVFALENGLVQGLNKQFSRPQFYHSSAAAIEAAFKLSGQQEGPSVFLNLEGEHFEVVFIQDGKLHFYNRFPSRTADEFNYFLLHLFDSLAIKPEHTDWIVAGDLNKLYLDRLKKYDADYRIADRTSLLKVSESFEALADGEYFSLLALALCE